MKVKCVQNSIVMKYSSAAEKILFSRKHKETYLFGMELNECNIIMISIFCCCCESWNCSAQITIPTNY